MPDLGQSGRVGDEKRSDSLDDFPRVVEAREEKREGSEFERDEPQID